VTHKPVLTDSLLVVCSDSSRSKEYGLPTAASIAASANLGHRRQGSPGASKQLLGISDISDV
jgi:hypothetical protein